MSLKPGTVVKIYKGTPRFEDGAVSRVLDYDPMQKEYLVGENIGEDDHWVKEDVVAEIDFEKKKSNILLDPRYSPVELIIAIFITMYVFDNFIK